MTARSPSWRRRSWARQDALGLGRAICLVVALALLTLVSAAAEPAKDLEPASGESSLRPSWDPTAAGDVQAASDALEQTGAATSPARIGLSRYLADLTNRIRQAIASWLERILQSSKGLGTAIAWGAVALVVIAIAALLVWIMTLLLRVWRHRTSGPSRVSGDDVETLPEPVPDLQADAAAWRQRLQTLLAEGKLDQALEALWWWLARSLVGSDADPSWTSRELVERGGRKDLLSLVRRLDAFQYGPLAPSSSQIELLTQDLERALA